MSVQTMPRHRLAAALLGFGLVAGACGGSAATAAPVTPVPTIATAPPTASPTPVPTATPTAAPTATPTAAPTATATAGASAAVDPAASLAIAAPYALVELDPATAAAMQSSIESGLGAYSSLFHIGTREVTNAGKLAAYVMVMQFPTGTLTDTTYQAVLGGITASSKTTFKLNDVAGTPVSTGTLSTVSVGIFKSGDDVVLVLAITQPEVLPIAKALITSN
jgi:hypothetical protein